MPRCTLISMLVLLGLGGCEQFNNAREGESLLDVIRGPSTLDAARMAADSYDADRRYRGTLILANLPYAGEKVYMDLFRAYSMDEDAAVRGAAARAIANHGEPTDATYLIALLKDEEVLVRREAAKGLQRLHNSQAIDALVSRLDDTIESDAQVRAEAAEALGQYDEPRVVDALIVALDDQQLSVNRNTVRSLRTLTGQDFGFSRREWSRWLRAATNPFAARGVYEFPAYQRRLRWYEYLPLVEKPILETPGVPTGFPLPGKA